MEIDPRLRSTDTSPQQSVYPPPPPPSRSLGTNPLRAGRPHATVPSASGLPPALPDESQQEQRQQQQSPYYELPPSESNQSDPNAPNDAKRPRACEACRGLKVRCDPNSQNPDGPCRRCAKAGRDCVVTVPSRKRQKKTDSRVAELEKKIDALTASLHATQAGENRRDSDSNQYSREGTDYDEVLDRYGSAPIENNRETGEWLRQQQYTTTSKHDNPALRSAPTTSVAGRKRRLSEENGPQDNQQRSPIKGTTRQQGTMAAMDAPITAKDDSAVVYPFLMPKTPRSATGPSITPDSVPGPSKVPYSPYTDVIDRGLLSSETATTIFNYFVEKMGPLFPCIVFTPDMTAGEIRKTKPILFLSIIAVGASVSYPDLQRSLTKEIMNIFGDRVVGNGEKSIELLQALLISVLWYWPPEHYEQLKFYQLTHMAMSMAIDLGIFKKYKPLKARHPAVASQYHSRKMFALPDPATLGSRRLWLAVYFLCSNVAVHMRRPHLLTWTNYLKECTDVLETSSDSVTSDLFLCQLVRGQQIAEQVAFQFSMDDPFATVTLSDPKTQYQIKGFEKDLEHWKALSPKHLDEPTLTMCESHLDLYIHEVALHVDHNVDDFKPPFTEETLRYAVGQGERLTPAHIAALSTCLKSIHTLFETLIALDVKTMRALPVFYLVRCTYTMVMLIKMHFATMIPNSEMSGIFKKEDLRAEDYVERVLEKFKATTDGDRSRPAARFLMMLMMLRTWFQRQKDGCGTGRCPREEGQGDGSRPASAFQLTNSQGSNNLDQNGQPAENAQDYGTANTPLQLLSEVAMGNSNGVDGSIGKGRYNNVWSSSLDTSNMAGTYGMGMQGQPGIVNPTGSQIFGTDYGMFPPGFDTTPAGDFSTFFMDDEMLSTIMDGGPIFENYGVPTV